MDAFDRLVHDAFPLQNRFWYRIMCCTCETVIKYTNGVAPVMSKNVRHCLTNSWQWRISFVARKSTWLTVILLWLLCVVQATSAILRDYISIYLHVCSSALFFRSSASHFFVYLPSSLKYKPHFSRQLDCWSLGCSCACGRSSNYILILNLTPGFNGLGKDNYNMRREPFKFWDLVRLILKT